MEATIIVDPLDETNQRDADKSAKIIGKKAIGLLKIPRSWTPKFILVTSELFDRYRSTYTSKKHKYTGDLFSHRVL